MAKRRFKAKWLTINIAPGKKPLKREKLRLICPPTMPLLNLLRFHSTFSPNYELKNMLQSSISVFNRLSLERPRNSMLNFLLHLEIGNRDHLSLKDKMNLFMTTYL